MTTESGAVVARRGHLIPRILSISASDVLQVLLLAGIFLLNFFAETDPDLWWHLATGRYIVETGAVPSVDPFSYTAVGQPWVAHEWLSEVALYLLYRSGGYVAAVVLCAVVVALTFWMVLRATRATGVGVAVAVCLTLWAALMARPGWNVRPQIFSYLFFALYLALLLRARRTSDRWLWLLPPVMVVWVNLHAGYVMGLLLVGLFLVGEAVNRWRRMGSGATPLQSYLWVGLATVAATVANPRGFAMLLYPFSYAGSQNASMRFVAEWRSPDFHDHYFFIFGASLMVLMVLPRRRPLDWALGLPLLGLTAMSLQAVRVVPFYAVVFAPFFAGAFPPSVLHETARRTPWNSALLVIGLAIMASTLFLSDRPQLGAEPRTTGFPVAGVRYLQEAGLSGNLFNSYDWGGFLVWSFYPQRRVFIDGRADMYGNRFVDEFRTVYEGLPGWQQVLDRYRVEAVLVEKDSRAAVLLAGSGAWKEVFRGDVETILVRKGGTAEKER